jgi:hypothetical protein
MRLATRVDWYGLPGEIAGRVVASKLVTHLRGIPGSKKMLLLSTGNISSVLAYVLVLVLVFPALEAMLLSLISQTSKIGTWHLSGDI